jgi:hypothetical protein
MLNIFKIKPPVEQCVDAIWVCTYSMTRKAFNHYLSDADYTDKSMFELEYACRGIVDACVQTIVTKRLLSIYGADYFDVLADELWKVLSQNAQKEIREKGLKQTGHGGAYREPLAIMKEWGQMACDDWDNSGVGLGSILILREQLLNKDIEPGKLQTNPFKSLKLVTEYRLGR